jgi:hypothetical protein
MFFLNSYAKYLRSSHHAFRRDYCGLNDASFVQHRELIPGGDGDSRYQLPVLRSAFDSRCRQNCAPHIFVYSDALHVMLVRTNILMLCRRG